MASLCTSKVFSDLRQRVDGIFDHYMAYGNPSLAATHAAEIAVVHRDFTRFLSSEGQKGKGLKQQLFGEVVARVIRQKAEDALPAGWKQILLVQLSLYVFRSPENLTGVLNVQTLVSEFGNRLLNLGTQLSEFIRDGDTESAYMDPTLASFTNLGCFMSAITTNAAQRPIYPLDDDDLWSLGRNGADLVLGILRADHNLDISVGFVRLKLFRVATTWFEENKNILNQEICEEHDLRLCQHQLFGFCDSDWLEDADRDGEFLVLAEHASNAALRSLKNLENRFGHQELLKVLNDYPDDWVEWILNSLQD